MMNSVSVIFNMDFFCVVVAAAESEIIHVPDGIVALSPSFPVESMEHIIERFVAAASQFPRIPKK